MVDNVANTATFIYVGSDCRVDRRA